MTERMRTFFPCIVGLVLLNGAAALAGAVEFPPFSALPAQAGFPDPLVRLDGRRVASRAEWFQERRPELQALFQHYMYGPIPPKPAQMEMKVAAEYADFLGGKATLKLVTLKTGPDKAPQIDLMLVIPNARPGKVPVFLALNASGNHALMADARVPLARTPLRDGSIATEAGRGAQAADWPLAEIVRRGYALATFYTGDVDPDRKDVSSGLYAWLAKGDKARNRPADRGTLSAWVWGVERCVDYLVTDPAVDAHRIAVLGHSRNGKAALLAAAMDERIALAFPHQAGYGGSAPSRSHTGESIKLLNDHRPHWFNGEFKKFNDAPERLPFDQNGLVALCAPRPVLFSAAQEDQAANPAGQFEILKAADPVYGFLGVEGLSLAAGPASQEMPPLHQLVGRRLGYYIREGKHSMTPADWAVFMDFADRQWAGKAPGVDGR